MPVFLFLAGKWLELDLCAVPWQLYAISDALAMNALSEVTKHFKIKICLSM
jgi:hypothetical protein